MARIDIMGGGQRIGQNVATAKKDPSAAGAFWAQVGRTAGAVSSVAAHEIKKFEKAEAIEFANNGAIDFQTELQGLSKFQADYADKPDGLGDAQRTHIDTYRDNYLKNAPSEMAREMYLQRTQPSYASSVVGGYAKEKKFKVYNFSKSLDNVATNAANKQFESPNSATAQYSYMTMKQQIDTVVDEGLLSPEEGDFLIDKYTQQLQNNYSAGLTNKNFAGIGNDMMAPETKSAVFDTMLKKDDFLKSMPANKKAALKAKADKAFKITAMAHELEMRQGAEQLASNLNSGVIDVTDASGIEQLQNFVKATEGAYLSDEAKVSLREKLYPAIVGRIIETADVSGTEISTDAVVAEVSTLLGAETAGLTESMLNDMIQKSRATRMLEANKDMDKFADNHIPGVENYVGAMTSNDPAMRQAAATRYIETRDSLGKTYNVSEEAISGLPTETYKIYGNRFKSLISTQSIEGDGGLLAEIDKLAGLDPEHSYSNLRKAELPNPLIAAMEITDTNARAQVMQAHLNRREINKAFKERPDAKDVTENNIRNWVSQSAFLQGIKARNFRDNTVYNYADMHQLYTDVIKAYVVDGMAPKDAATKAENIFARGMQTVPQGGDPGQAIMIPSQYYSTRAMEGVAMLIDKTQSADIDFLQKNLNLYNEDDIMLAAEGTWSYNEADQRVYLMIEGVDGWQKARRRTVKREPISFSASEFESLMDEEDKRIYYQLQQEAADSLPPYQRQMDSMEVR